MDEYGRFASLYDPVVTPFLRPIYGAMLDVMARRRCETMIDLCCGTGTLAGMAARNGMDVVGVDLSSAMLEIARRKHPVRFMRGDASSLDFPDASFDAACISFALHEKPQPTALSILAEARRTVRPGGVILVADYRQPSSGRGVLTGWAIRLVERFAGRDHHACFSAYMADGGSDVFLSRAGLSGQCVQTFLSGWAGVYAAG